MKKKIVLIGCGKIFSKHVSAIYKNKKKFKLVGICDENKKKLDNININVKKFLSLNQLINSKLDFDIATICSPSGLHKNQAIKMLKHKKHVLVEKPMALTSSDCNKMILESKKNKKELFVCLQNRFNPTIIELKKILLKKKLGKIYMINCNIFWHRSQKYYDQDNWRGTKNLDGGALMNQSIHFIDLLMWLFGETVTSQVLRAKLGRNIETEDSAIINILFKKNILCSVSATILTNDKNYEGSITVLGEKGKIKIGGISLNKIIDWNINNKEMSIKQKKKIYLENKNTYKSGHQYIYNEISKYLDKKKSNVIKGLQGAKSVYFIDNIYKKNKLIR